MNPEQKRPKIGKNPAFAFCTAFQPCVGKVIDLLPLGFSPPICKRILLSWIMSRKGFNHQAERVCVHTDIRGWTR